MHSPQDIENLLNEFGLTTTQAKIFLAITRLGFAPVREIARHSRVRREQVYRITPQLEELGLIIRGLDIPTRFRAIPMSEALSLLLDTIQENADTKIASLTVKKKRFERNFNLETIQLQNEETNPQFTLISERHRILNRIRRMIQQATNKIYIIYSRHKIQQFVSLYEDVLSDAQQKGVTTHIITEGSEVLDDASSLTKQLNNFEWLNIRYAAPPLVHFIMVDKGELMLATSTNLSIGDHPKLWTTDEDIVIELHLYFESIWKNARDTRDPD